MVQEALNNCVKHSQASEVRVVMQRDAEGLSISVQDDGVGFDPEHNKGLGLLGMMERVSALGGRFHIESQTGRGTVLSTYFCWKATMQSGRGECSLIRIILADDHAVMRRGLRLVLEQQKDFEVVGEASDGRGAVDLAETARPDIAVLDITMPNLNGIEAARQINAKQIGVSTIVLSMHADESFVLRALKAGARGYLLKESAESDLINAVRLVSEGKSFFSPTVSRMLVEDYVRQLRDKGVEDSYELLTSRERETPATHRRGEEQQRHCQYATPEPLHRGDSQEQHSGQTQPSHRA